MWYVQGNSCYLIEMLNWLSPLIDYDLECNVKKQIIHNPAKKLRKGIELKGGVNKELF